MNQLQLEHRFHKGE